MLRNTRIEAFIEANTHSRDLSLLILFIEITKVQRFDSTCKFLLMEVKPQVLWCFRGLDFSSKRRMDTSAPKSYWGWASCQDRMIQEKFGNPLKVMACWMVNRDSFLITEYWQRCVMITGIECFWMVQFKVFLADVLDFFHGAQLSCSHLVFGGWKKWDLRIAGWCHSSGRTGVWGKKSVLSSPGMELPCS